MTTRRNPSHWSDVLLLVVSIVAATAAVVYLTFLMFDVRCLAAGGRVVVGGLDRLCVLADGRNLPDTPITPAGWALGFGLWLGLVAAMYWGMSRFMRGRRTSDARR